VKNDSGNFKALFEAKRKPPEVERTTSSTPRDFTWLEKNIPCQKACPAGTDIPGYLTALAEGNSDEAYRINLRDNVFPAVLGRVCSRPCEASCRHGWEGLGDSVAICFSKRSSADFLDKPPVLLEPWFPSSGKRVAIIGGGVAGLTTARQLALLGHQVVVHEKYSKPGGMLNQGIPEFRLPRSIIDREIAQIVAQGVEIICNSTIGKEVQLNDLITDYDAVIMAAGTQHPNYLDLPGKELKGIQHGLEFLQKLNATGEAEVGERVIVIGGGFTAMDCARTARRLGATTLQLEEDASPGSILRIPKDQVDVWYRRSPDEMTVTPGELEELEHEHIPIEFMVTPKAYLGEQGQLTGIQFIRTELGKPDSNGRRRPIEIEGTEFEVAVDTLLLATSQFPDQSWVERPEPQDRIKLFSAGDFSTGARSLIDAIADGKRCAREVDAYLMGEIRLTDLVVTEVAKTTGRTREMDEIERQSMPSIPLNRRDLPTEVETGYTKTSAIEEAKRCYRCDYKFEIDPVKCILCDWCVQAKPIEKCIIQLKTLNQRDDGSVVSWEPAEKRGEITRVWINEEECIRCGACVKACPVDAITLHKVKRVTEPRP
jgi:NADPH-dependent glutamate synthase beta subunit-like oxidoreductase